MTDFSGTIKNLVSFSDFNRGQAGKIFDSVKKTGAKLVMKNNNPECVLLSPEEYIQMCQDIEDLYLLIEAAERTNNIDSNDLFTQEEVDRIFGMDKEDYKDSDEVEIE